MKLFSFFICGILLCIGCQNPSQSSTAGVNGQTDERPSSGKEEPLKFAAVIQTDTNKVALVGTYDPGIAVGLLDFESGEVITATTVGKENFRTEDDVILIITTLDLKALPGNSLRVAVVSYDGQPFSLAGADTLKDGRTIGKIRDRVNDKNAIEKALLESLVDVKPDPGLVEKLEALTPTIIRVDIPGSECYIYQSADITRKGIEPAPFLFIADNTISLLAGPCGAPGKPFQLGNGFFILTTFAYCESDVFSDAIYRLSSSGAKIEYGLSY